MTAVPTKHLQVLLDPPEWRVLKSGEVVVSTVSELLEILSTLDPTDVLHVHGGGPYKGRFLTFWPASGR